LKGKPLLSLHTANTSDFMWQLICPIERLYFCRQIEGSTITIKERTKHKQRGQTSTYREVFEALTCTVSHRNLC